MPHSPPTPAPADSGARYLSPKDAAAYLGMSVALLAVDRCKTLFSQFGQAMRHYVNAGKVEQRLYNEG